MSFLDRKVTVIKKRLRVPKLKCTLFLDFERSYLPNCLLLHRYNSKYPKKFSSLFIISGTLNARKFTENP